jgi:2-polyprenyl-3-methyl-5-hydroxy-6-metoxy-1,4-benzoquinol methylase
MFASNDIQARRFQWFVDVTRRIDSGLRILDIGCQTGEVCARLRALGHEPCGVDACSELIERARASHPGIHFEPADCECGLPFDDHSFDLVWAGDVIEHIRFTDVFVNEINRVLKPQGHCILTTPMHNRLKATLIALLNFERHFDPEFPHYRFYTARSLAAVFQRRGFVVRSVTYLGRIRPIAQAMGVVAVKVADKWVASPHRY